MLDTVQKSTLLPIQWDDSGVVSRYATNLAVQHTEHEFILSFFEARPPIAMVNVAQEDELDSSPTVKAQCVCRIIISSGRMSEFIDVLTKNQAQHQARFNNGEP